MKDSNSDQSRPKISRRAFVYKAVGTLGVMTATSALSRSPKIYSAASNNTEEPEAKGLRVFSGEHLDQVAFPTGGIGAGMICLDGVGGLTHASIQHRPEIERDVGAFAAISIQSPVKCARIVEGPVMRWRLFQAPHAASGGARNALGLPRFEKATFHARFPFGHVALADADLPLIASIAGWSPFEPGDADNASLPVAGLEYTFTNRSGTPVEAVFSYNIPNFIASENVIRDLKAIPGGVEFYTAANDTTGTRKRGSRLRPTILL